LFFSYNTTGGKISYSDYSGVIRVTQPLEGYTIGGNYQIKLLKTSKNNNDLFIGFKGLCTYSTFSIESYSQVLDDINEDSFDLYSIDYGIGVNLIYEYKLSFFKIMATAGFDAVLGGKL